MIVQATTVGAYLALVKQPFTVAYNSMKIEIDSDTVIPKGYTSRDYVPVDTLEQKDRTNVQLLLI